MTIFYTNRSIWFSGLCFSELEYDSLLSTKEFIANACSTTVYAWSNT